ncbi:MAG: ATP-binding protein [Bacteroidota bacterium]
MSLDSLAPEKALQELDKISPVLEKDFPELFALAQCLKAWQYFNLEKLAQSHALLKIHLPKVEPMLDDWQKAKFQYAVYEYWYEEQPDSINFAEAKQFRETLIQIETVDTLLQNEMYWTLGYDQYDYASRYGRYAEALNYLYDLIELIDTDSLHFDRFRYKTTYALGATYYLINDLEKSREFFLQTIEATEQSPDPDKLDFRATTLHFLGIIYRTEGDTAQWEVYTDKAIQIFDGLNTENIIPVQMDFTEYLIAKDRLQEAEYYLTQIDANLKKYQVEHPYFWGGYYSTIARFEFAQGNPQSALAWIEKSYQADEDAQSRSYVLPLRQKYAEAVGKYELALESLKEYQGLYEAGMSVKQIEVVDELEKKHALAEQKREAAYLLETKTLQDKQLNLQRTLLIITFIALFLMAALSFYLYRLGERLKGANGLLRKQKADLSAAKETAIAATKAKADFLSVMSHEIRTPMNGVIGTTDLLAATQLDEEQEDLVQTINHSADSLLTIINDILDFSKIESGNLEIEQIAFSLHNCLAEVMNLFAPSAAEKGLVFNARIDPNVPEGIIGDPVRLKQILSNLISNAIKFTKEGEIKVSVALATVSELEREKDIALIFSVQDSGIGIPKEKQERLFKAFSQADTSTTRKYGGTGLGLAISAQLSRLMGGEIWVESNSTEGSTHRGATFRFRILSQKANQIEFKPSITEKAHSLSQKLADKFPLSLLVAEDNKVNQKLVLRMLSKLGYQADLVQNGQDAVEMALKNAYDLILMDVQMPIMDGIMATQTIIDSLQTPPTIIAMTANALKEDIDRCQAVGMAGHLGKPFRSPELIKVLKKFSSPKL